MPKNKKGGSYVTRASKDQSFLLHCIDIDLAKEQQLAGCPYCGGPLHHSSYQRKPRGGPDSIPDEYLVRLSLCCGREDCWRRTLPPSSLFMGRRVCWRCVISALKHVLPVSSLSRVSGKAKNILSQKSISALPLKAYHKKQENFWADRLS
jgi:hypothetical protein